MGGPRTPGAAALASLHVRRNQSGVELEVVEHEATHEEAQVVRDAGYEEEQLDECGLAHLAQNPSGQVDVALRAKQEPLDLHRAERERNDRLRPPPGKEGRLVPLQ